MDDMTFNEKERSIVLTSDQALVFYGIESSRPFQINGRLANVGDMLRHAREHKKMSVDFLSSKINLDSKMIRQLESNQYDNLPGETYIRGYISLVARELGADIDPLLKVYEIQNRGNNLEPMPLDNKKPSQLTVQLKSWGVFSGIILFAIAALGIYYLSYFGKIEESNSIVEKKLTKIDRTTENDQKSSLAHQSYNAYEQLNELSNRIGPEIAEEERYPEIDNEKLIIRAKSGTWIEIFDTFGAVLYSDLVASDQTLELLGEPPYNLIIGDGSAVVVEYRGRIIDLNNFIDSTGVARLELGNL